MADKPTIIDPPASQPSAPRIPTMILRLPVVAARTGLSRTTIYRKVRLGQFPRPRQLSIQCVGWIEADIEAWIRARLETAANDR